jgi:hypothetical protein
MLILLLQTLSTGAQELFTSPTAQKLATIPFRSFSGGVMILRAKLDQYPDSLNFILDTGSGGISLDSNTVDRLQIPTVASDRTIRGIAGIKKVRFANNHTLHFPGLRVDSLNFHINDYEILTSVYGEHIDGIIGYSFLSRYIVQLDYDSAKMKVYTKGLFRYPRGGYLLKPLIVNIPVINSELDDRERVNHRFYFDSGAGLCLLLSEDFVKDSALLSSKRKTVITQAEGLGGKAQMKLTTIKGYKLGPYKFKQVPTFIFEDEYNVTSYPYLGGLVGNDLLRRFNTTFNYDKREIHLVPNSHFRESFDYSYTGLGFYYIDHQIVVTDIMKDSPAERAGFKEGDVIISINNNLSGNIQSYKTLIQTTGEKLRVVVLRDGKPMEIRFKVESILKR